MPLWYTCGMLLQPCKRISTQMEWHKNNIDTDLSLVGIEPSMHVELARIQEQSISYCQGKSPDLHVRNALMISVCV